MSDQDLLSAFVEAGVLGPLDLHFAQALGRLGEDSDQTVLLAAALASRAPRAGHTCADLQTVSQAIRLEREAPSTPLPWPEPAAWLEAVARSPLVRRPHDDLTRPLLLEGTRLHLDRYWRYQQRLVAALEARASTATVALDPTRLDADLDHFFPVDPALEGAPDLQRLAAKTAAERRFTVITGGPGTGKTTTVLKLLLVLLSQARALAPSGRAAWPPSVHLLAPTGKAAARLAESLTEGLASLKQPVDAELAEALPSQATTIHRALGYQPRSPTRFRHDADHPLGADVVVVDEASMVDLALFAKLVDAVPPSARLVLLGDRDQLASVEAGAVLGDICGVDRQGARSRLSDCLVHLTRTWRFGADSGIGNLARAVNAGEVEAALQLLRGPAEDIDLIELSSDARGLPAALLGELVRTWTPIVRAPDPTTALSLLGHTRVLCAHRRGSLGVEGINRALQEALEAAGAIRPRGPFWSGRPVLVRRNDPELGLFNGDIGLLLPEPDSPQGALWAWFPGAPGTGPRRLHPARLPVHDTVFAMTVHQSQGSQFAHPVVVLPARPSAILTRELLYTGITRARQQVTVVASESALQAGIEARVVRQSGLGAALWTDRAGMLGPGG